MFDCLTPSTLLTPFVLIHCQPASYSLGTNSVTLFFCYFLQFFNLIRFNTFINFTVGNVYIMTVIQTQRWWKFHQFELHLFESSSWIESPCVTRRPNYLETVKRFRLLGNRLVPLYISIVDAAFRDVCYTVLLFLCHDNRERWRWHAKNPFIDPTFGALVLLFGCLPRVPV